MKILVIGGTGFLGSHLVPKLVDEQHQITVLTRQKHFVNQYNTNYIIGDILFPETFENNLEKIELTILIAMPKVNLGERINRKRYRELKSQITLYFKNSINLAKKLKCPIIVTSGASFQTKFNETADESWPILREGIARIGEDTDLIIEENLISDKPFIIQMLPGQIYGNGGVFKTQIEWILNGKFKIIGNGNNYIPRIHVEDCANAYVQVVRKLPLGEKFIIADDQPCTVNEFTNFITDNLQLERCSHLPILPVLLIKGNLILKTILMNCKVTNKKAKTELDWELKYPSYKEGLKQVISELS